jgi:hypothetical protein
LASNSTSHWLGDQLEPIPGRLVHSKLGSWQWLSLYIPGYVPGYDRARIAAEFIHHRVQLGPIPLHKNWPGDTAGGLWHQLIVNQLPGNPAWIDSIQRLGGRINWNPVLGDTPGNIWNFSFGIAGVSRELAGHFTLGSFAGGAVADVVVGAIWQGVEDELAYGLWLHNPELAFRRTAAAAGANATIGLAGGITTGVVLAAGIGLLHIPTPPTWVIGVATIGVTVAWGYIKGDEVEEIWFRWLAR